MHRRIFFLYCLSIFYAVNHLTGQELTLLKPEGGWHFRQQDTGTWYPAEIPGVVHLDLMRNGLIPDPFYRDNEAKVQWVGEAEWEYRATFLISREQIGWQHIELLFMGIDTYAAVYLNDSLALTANNMFREWTADVKGILKEGDNDLRIIFSSAIKQNRALYGQLPYKLPGDEKVVCRKAAYHFGWDWGPTLVTAGIWRPVYLRFRNAAEVKEVQFIQKELAGTHAVVDARFSIFSDKEDSVSIRIENDHSMLGRERALLRPGFNEVIYGFEVRDPRLWWPNGMGVPYLYDFSYTVETGDGQISEGRQRIGLRTIELVREKDEKGSTFFFRVNGKPVFIKGANYIPQDNFLPRVSDSTYRSLIGKARSAGMNMLRVWGGGIYENDIFYDLCDENGIMVWQDFMFACAMYPGNDAFMENVHIEAEGNVKRLRNHACLALWCGNNEIDEGWKNWGWQKQYGYNHADSASVYDNYLKLFHRTLPDCIRQFDSGRAYIPTSPQHGWGRTASLTEGDSHYWGVWWGKEPFSFYEKKTGRFMSEYGFQGFPDPSTIAGFTLPDDKHTGSAVLKVHQKHPVGFEIIDEYLGRDFRKPKDFSSYAYVSQLLQLRGIVTAIEAHRRAKPYCMGTLYWQLNDCWPVVSWSSVDYYGKKKALHYALKEAYGKILISPVMDEGRLKVWIVSDDTAEIRSVLSVRLLDFNGKTLSGMEKKITLAGNSSQVFLDTLQSALLGDHDPGGTLLLVTLKGTGPGTQMILRRICYFTTPKELKLPHPGIEKKVTQTMDGYRIMISADKLVKNLCLTSEPEGEFSDNYFDLLPGETVAVQFRTRERLDDMGDRIFIKSLVDTYYH